MGRLMSFSNVTVESEGLYWQKFSIGGPENCTSVYFKSDLSKNLGHKDGIRIKKINACFHKQKCKETNTCLTDLLSYIKNYFM